MALAVLRCSLSPSRSTVCIRPHGVAALRRGATLHVLVGRYPRAVQSWDAGEPKRASA